MPRIRQSAANRIIAARMFQGGSGGRRPESFWKKTNQGNLMPAWRKTPADAAASRYQTIARPWRPAASEIIDFDTNPEVSGKEEIDKAPTMPQIVVSGMVRKRPPRSVHLRLPVMKRTEPADITSSAL